MIFEYAFLAVITLSTSFFIWAIFANNITFRKRMAMLDAMEPGGVEFRMKMNAYAEVSYDAHLWRVVTFRDPMTLYRPGIFQ